MNPINMMYVPPAYRNWKTDTICFIDFSNITQHGDAYDMLILNGMHFIDYIGITLQEAIGFTSYTLTDIYEKTGRRHLDIIPAFS